MTHIETQERRDMTHVETQEKGGDRECVTWCVRLWRARGDLPGVLTVCVFAESEAEAPFA